MGTILIIDDDPDLRSLLRRSLERKGFEVREAEHGAAGREILETYAADLVICDVMMPGETGIETIGRIAPTRPELKIIAISGGSLISEQYLAAAVKAGAHRTFKKPFSLKELTGAVQELLSEG